MNREQYLAKRKGLMDEAQKLIDSGKLDAAAAKAKEVEELDAQFENAARAQANLNALSGRAVGGMQNAAVTGPVSAPVAGVDMSGAAVEVDRYDTAEYKNAFMAYVMRGTDIPAKLTNEVGPTKTPDVGTVIPTTTLQKIIDKMETIGMVLPLVTRTAYKGGLAVPTAGVKPVASWVAEGAGSDKQKTDTGSIVFGYHKLRCAISMTYEVDNMAYPMFETFFVNAVADAMVKAKETAIINGTGSGQPKGILRETPAHTEVLGAGGFTYEQLLELEGMQEYDGAVWSMTRQTYFGKVLGMVDQQGQPIARVTAGISGRPEYSIFGRRVVFLHPDYLSGSNVLAFMFDYSDYIFNSGVPMTTKRYFDEDVDDTVVKAVEICDGKVVQDDSLITVTSA